MKTLPIREQTLEMVLSYLARCPFADVERIIVSLRQDIQQAQQQARAPEVKNEPPVK